MQVYYSFRFEGEQNGELIPKYRKNGEKEGKDEELEQDKMTSIMLHENIRKKHQINIEFKN